MKILVGLSLIACALLVCFSGCAGYRTQKVVPTPILHAQEEIAEDQLLDVGIAVFESEELTDEKAKKEGTHPEIRKAESHFIPYHLKNTLQQSSHWGAVRIIPAETDTFDLVVKGEIVESNGERLILKVEVIDSAGNTWLRKKYKAEAREDSYSANVPGSKDAFQDLYNTIANDLTVYKDQLDPAEIKELRTISKLKFAQDFAPDAFNGYLATDRRGRSTINRVPAADDAQMERLLQVREREYMFIDTLNEYYDGFYNEMWPEYENWRKFDLTERTALRQVQRDAFFREAAGVLMLALAVALDAGNVVNSPALRNILILGGGAVIVDGINVSRQAQIHEAAIKELSDSFGSEMKPVVMEFQDKKYQLTGSAKEQYAQWRELLRKIYYAETGFDRADESMTEDDGDQ